MDKINNLYWSISDRAEKLENTLGPYANRLGSIPVIGTIVGIFRYIISSMMFVAFGFLETLRFIEQGETETPFGGTKFSLKHLVLGLAELIPIVGTITHLFLHNAYRDDLRNQSFTFRKYRA